MYGLHQTPNPAVKRAAKDKSLYDLEKLKPLQEVARIMDDDYAQTWASTARDDKFAFYRHNTSEKISETLSNLSKFNHQSIVNNNSNTYVNI